MVVTYRESKPVNTTKIKIKRAKKGSAFSTIAFNIEPTVFLLKVDYIKGKEYNSYLNISCINSTFSSLRIGHNIKIK